MNPILEPILGWMAGEKEGTLRMLTAIPEARMNEKIHDKFKTAAELGMHIYHSINELNKTLKQGEIVFNPDPEPFATVDELANGYETAMSGLLETIKGLTDEQLFKNYPMEMNGQVMWDPKGPELISGYVCHEIHHRGQLSLVIRLLDGKVPGVYGPSADEWGN